MFSAEQFTSHFLEALQGGGLPSFRRKVRDVEVLLIDDLQFFTGKRATIRGIAANGGIAITARSAARALPRTGPGALKGLGTEFVGRLSGGLVCGIEPADFATRLGIARQMGQAMGLDVPGDVLELIAGELQGDARQISGALNRLRATSELWSGPSSYEFAGESLEDVFRSTQRFVHLSDIERAVCEVFGLDGRSLRRRRKAKTVSSAPHAGHVAGPQVHACRLFGDRRLFRPPQPQHGHLGREEGQRLDGQGGDGATGPRTLSGGRGDSAD